MGSNKARGVDTKLCVEQIKCVQFLYYVFKSVVRCILFGYLETSTVVFVRSVQMLLVAFLLQV